MSQQKQARINKQIKASTVLLIDAEGTNVGKVDLIKALNMATSAGLDLVEVNSGNVTVCRIMDYGKWKYDQSKRLKKSKNNSSKQVTKEVKFRPTTGTNDLVYRAKRVDQFIKDGHRVKLSVRFRGREMEHMYDTGRILLEKFLDLISVDISFIGTATAEGNSIVQLVGPNDSY